MARWGHRATPLRSRGSFRRTPLREHLSRGPSRLPTRGRMRNGTDHWASARPKSITIVQTQQHSVILSSFTRFLDLSLDGFHSAVVPSDGLEPRHVTGRIDMWTEMCDRRKCNDTFRSIPSSVLLTAATAGRTPLATACAARSAAGK